jgi:glycosyltransferase involved in cell wall biosynthesis
MNAFPHVSIILPVLNREKTVGRCLESLMELDYPSYEVIVIDNGSTDTTYEIASHFPVTLLTEDRRGPYAARNKGLLHAQGKMVCFIDSDCLAHRDWLKKLVRNFTDENIAGVGGQLQTYEPQTLVEQFEDFAGILVYNLPKGFVQWDKHKFLSGAVYASNVMFRKKILLEAKGFDADFMSGGDYHLCWKLQRMGYKLLFDPEAVVKHVHRSSIKGLIHQFYKYGVEQPRLLKKQPGGFSYLKLKTYFFAPYELRCKMPLQLLVSIDCCHLFFLSFTMIVLSPLFLYSTVGILSLILLGVFRDTVKVMKKSGEKRWLLLYPFFHLIRNYSFIIGRVCGGVKHGIVAI